MFWAQIFKHFKGDMIAQYEEHRRKSESYSDMMARHDKMYANKKDFAIGDLVQRFNNRDKIKQDRGAEWWEVSKGPVPKTGSVGRGVEPHPWLTRSIVNSDWYRNEAAKRTPAPTPAVTPTPVPTPAKSMAHASTQTDDSSYRSQVEAGIQNTLRNNPVSMGFGSYDNRAPKGSNYGQTMDRGLKGTRTRGVMSNNEESSKLGGK